MSGRFWLSGIGVIAGSMVLGTALGHYATNIPQRSMARLDGGIDDGAGAAFSTYDPDGMESTSGPARIICKGCGPTLAERRQAAEMAGLDADGMMGESSDPIVRDYLNDAPPQEGEGDNDRPSPVNRLSPVNSPSPVSGVPVASSPAHRLPANIERFAANAMAERVDAPRPLGAPASVVTVAPPAASDDGPASRYAATAHREP